MTPEERAAAIVEAQGDDLTRYQRMFLAGDIAKEIREAVQAERGRSAALWHDLYAEIVGSYVLLASGVSMEETSALIGKWRAKANELREGL